MSQTFVNIRHLYSRAGFGFSFENFAAQKNKSIQDASAILFEDAKEFKPIEVTDKEVYTPLFKYQSASPNKKKEIREYYKSIFTNLNVYFLNRMSQEKLQLRERMTFFWHGYFACRNINPLFIQQLNNAVRKNALGNFKVLLMDVATSPAMLQFLNNQQNKKQHPNENFARELMELFTIGRGNYSENDVKEAARAFTGWSVNLNGEFEFRGNVHDYGMKSFMGKSGRYNGDDIIEIILEKKEAANFIAGRICKSFVSEHTKDEHVKILGENLFNSGYDIG